MSSLLGLLELLAHTPLSHDQTMMLDIARDSGRSIAGIIDDILDRTKIETGKIQIAVEPVSIDNLLKVVYNQYDSVARSKNLDLRYITDPHISPGLLGDQCRLMQVLGILVNNAIKFTAQGFVEMRADLIEREEGVETVRLSVHDTGIGISPEEQAHLFRPFEQADVEITHLFGGMRSSIHLCRKLTAMMGGELQVQSAQHEGSIFNVSLPLALSESTPVGPISAALRTLTSSESQMQTKPLNHDDQATAMSQPTIDKTPKAMWVLAVDDNQTNRILIQRQFNLLGLRVRTAIDGEQALELWKNGDYAMVLTDINMSALNGYDLARTIRGLEVANGRSRTPILGWTANDMADTHARCLTSGMDDVLHKPADLARMRELVARWLPKVVLVDVGSNPAGKTFESIHDPIETPAIDAKFLQESFGGDRNKLLELLPTIQKTLKGQIASMNTAFSASDLHSLKAWGHNISGSSGLMGAQTLMQVSQRIEAMADKGDLSALPDLAHQFNIQAQRTLDALSRLS